MRENGKHIEAVQCDECHQTVAQIIAGAVIIKERHFGSKHITVITTERMLMTEERNLRNSIKAV